MPPPPRPGSIGGRRPEYEDEEGDPVDEATRPMIESGEGVEEGFETAESDLIEAASHGENRYDPSTQDFGDDETAGEAEVESGEADEIEVPDGPTASRAGRLAAPQSKRRHRRRSRRGEESLWRIAQQMFLTCRPSAPQCCSSRAG